MLNTKEVTKRLSLLTIGLIVFSFIIALTNSMILWFLLVFILSIILIYKHKNNIQKADIIISFLLSLLVMISNVFIGIFVFPAYLSSIAILKGNHKQITLYNKLKKKELQRTLLSIFLLGGFLGFINLLLSLGSYQFNLSFQPIFIFDALRAGIFEEIIFRMFLFALCIEITGNIFYNKFQEILCYILMILPHVLLHFTSSFDIVSIIILSLLFGLPFCLLQRRVNLLSAIGAHSIVDFIRFIMLGI